MRILVTGVSARHVNSQRLRYKYINDFADVMRFLREDMGHTVEHRTVSFAEKDLKKKFDLLIVGLLAPSSMGAVHFTETMHAMSQFPRDRVRAAFDDWNCSNFQAGVRSTLKRGPAEWRIHSNPSDELKAMALEQTLRFHDPAKVVPVMTTLFPWADRDRYIKRVMPSATLFDYDPSPIVEKRPVPRGIVRDRRWVHAALADHSYWLNSKNFKWPVVSFGNKRLGQLILDEDGVHAEYCKSWGATAAPYPDGIAGWWRPRYIHAANAGTLMLIDGAEKTALRGTPYDLDVQVVEAMNDKELALAVKKQQLWLTKNTATLQQMREALTRAIEGRTK